MICAIDLVLLALFDDVDATDISGIDLLIDIMEVTLSVTDAKICSPSTRPHVVMVFQYCVFSFRNDLWREGGLLFLFSMCSISFLSFCCFKLFKHFLLS